MLYTITQTPIAEQTIAGIRTRGPVRELGHQLQRLLAALAAAGVAPTGPPMARFFAEEYDETDTDYEIAVPVAPHEDGSLPDTMGEVRIDVIPAHHAFVTTHVGPYTGLRNAYAALTAELDALGYTLAGPPAEVFLRGREATAASATWQTEVRFPIAR